MKHSIVLALALMISAAAMAQTQKFGYCNSVALLANMSEVKEADSVLKDFQTQLTKRGQEMVKDLQSRAEELERKKTNGTIAPKDYATQADKLQADQDSISSYEQEVYKKLGEKREQLYTPILEKVNKAMQDVAKEKGYMLVFDSTTQVLLYADESLDVTRDVAIKLGIAIKDEEPVKVESPKD
ncbi:MAG: OmpH family outer membrane protein [Lewinellaceae bacterium]|nr:OmpH family outer membrane protein [Lewinellaceae bacterium]